MTRLEMGKFLEEVFDQGYIYIDRTNSSLIEETVKLGFLHQEKPLGYEIQKGAYRLTSKGILEMNFWRNNHGKISFPMGKPAGSSSEEKWQKNDAYQNSKAGIIPK